MDRKKAVYNGEKFNAIVEGNSVYLVLNQAENGFKVSPYDKNLYEKEVQKQELEELYREYFIARYKGYDIFVFSDSNEDREVEVVTYDSNIGRECSLDQKDRDLFTKRLGLGDNYQLFYIKKDYLNGRTERKEVTLDQYFGLTSEKS